MAPVGQLSDPYSRSGDEQSAFSLSGLPGELHEPDDDPGEGPDDGPGRAHEQRPDGGSVDQRAQEADDGEPILVHELDAWSEVEREEVTDRLAAAGIAHWWVDAALHVGERDGDPVEAVLDQVEGVDEPLDGERDQVAYDMSEWDDDRLSALAATLRGAGIAYGWDGDELFVYAEDERAVDQLVDRAAHPHELPAEVDDGAAGAVLLGELFVAADRLQHDAAHQEGAAVLLDLHEALATLEVPYGLAPREWERLRSLTGDLADHLQAPSVDEDAAMAAAVVLRAALRRYV
jgi:hypothetical protein